MRRFARLFWLALVIVAAILSLILIPPWLRVLITPQAFHRSVVGFLLCLEVAYLVVVPACLIGALFTAFVVYRARKTGTNRTAAARGLLVCGSCLLVLGLAEGAIAAWSGWIVRTSTPAESALGRMEDPELPSQFAESKDDANFNLVVVGES